MRLFALITLGLGANAFTNPIRAPGGADPQVTYTDGWFYFIATEWTHLAVSRARSIDGLKTAESKVIYTDSNPSRCCNVWAPELHYLNGRWYIYYTAGEDGSENLGPQRSHVVVGGSDIWEDEWSYGAQLTEDWGIDGTIVRFNNYGNYFFYSCMTGVPHQSTCVRKLGDDNVSLTGPLSIVSRPDEPWEQSEVPVQEGQNALYFGGKTYVAYSANFCWTPDYCIALLEWDGSSDPMDPAAWKKSNGCVLTSANGHYGTGHNSFFQSPDGTETWTTFHATDISSGACDDRRYAMVQPLTANADGSPNFGRVEGATFVWPEPSGGQNM